MAQERSWRSIGLYGRIMLVLILTMGITVIRSEQSSCKFYPLTGRVLQKATTYQNISLESCGYLCARAQTCLAFTHADGVCSLSASPPVEAATNLSNITFVKVEPKAQHVLNIINDNKWTRYEKTTAELQVWYYGIGYVTLEECALDCTTSSSCMAFQYNIRENMCAIVGELEVSHEETGPSQQILGYMKVYLNTHLARGQESWLSSRYGGTVECLDPCCNYEACNGNDGHYGYDRIAHSGNEITPFWFVDLSDVYTVYALEFVNRIVSSTPEIAMRANDPEVWTADDNLQHSLCASVHGSIPAHRTLMSCVYPRKARYVWFMIHNELLTPLHFVEIEVHGV